MPPNAQLHTPVLLFDLDNTLIDRDGAFQRYLDDFLARHSAAFQGLALPIVRKDILALDAHGRMPRDAFCSAVLARHPALPYTPESLWQDHQRILDYFVPCPAIIAMLQKLVARYRLGLISNGSSTMQRQKIQIAGFGHLFSQVLISGELGVAKPHPAIFRQALDFFQVSTATMVGDDPCNDIQAAHQLGLRTVQHLLPGETASAMADCALTDILQLEEALSCST